MILWKRNGVCKKQAIPIKLAQLVSCLSLFIFFASVQSGPAFAVDPAPTPALTPVPPTPVPFVLSELHLNRPSSSWIGSVRVWKAVCSDNTCSSTPADGSAIGKCITLDKQNHVYNPGTVGPSSGVVLRRYDGANCEGNVNPQNQDVNVNQNGPTVVDVVSW